MPATDRYNAHAPLNSRLIAAQGFAERDQFILIPCLDNPVLGHNLGKDPVVTRQRSRMARNSALPFSRFAGFQHNDRFGELIDRLHEPSAFIAAKSFNIKCNDACGVICRQVFEVMAQYGIVEARDEYELVSFCEALSCYQTAIEGRVGIISVSGGHGALVSDVCTSHGLTLAKLSEQTQQAIRENLSPSVRPIASLSNPIDLTGSALDEDFVAAATGLSNSPEVDAVILLLLPYSPGISMDLGARLSYVLGREGKPLVAYVPHQEKYRMLIEGFELNNVPVSASIEGAVLMVEAIRRCKKC